MSTTPAESTSIHVWDLPVRVFHVLLALSFAGAYATAESERWRLVHVTLGYTLGGLVAFRLVWGVVGGRYARFASFVRGPGAVLRYLSSLVKQKPEHHVGHNPAGAIAIVMLLVAGLGAVISGWTVYQDQWGDWLEEVHEFFGNAMLGVVLVHIAGVLIASGLHRENLAKAMVTGCKRGAPEEAARESGVARWLAVAILLSVMGFWYVQWQTSPSQGDATAAGHAKWKSNEKDDD